tara:strand:- start:3153 stop:3647 length:495 start_codon:yes stop_codon:yes gene_type:complete
MHIIATTRFNEKTWKENCRWREKNNWKGCIYGTPKQVSESISLFVPMFILEMHNDENLIQGIGLIKNAVSVDRYYKIYSEGNYNRYTYKSEYRVDRKDMTEYEEKIMTIFDTLVFKGEKHLKRGQGIIAVPSWIKNNKHINFIQIFKNMFSTRFHETTSKISIN